MTLREKIKVDTLDVIEKAKAFENLEIRKKALLGIYASIEELFEIIRLEVAEVSAMIEIKNNTKDK